MVLLPVEGIMAGIDVGEIPITGMHHAVDGSMRVARERIREG